MCERVHAADSEAKIDARGFLYSAPGRERGAGVVVEDFVSAPQVAVVGEYGPRVEVALGKRRSFVGRRGRQREHRRGDDLGRERGGERQVVDVARAVVGAVEDGVQVSRQRRVEREFYRGRVVGQRRVEVALRHGEAHVVVDRQAGGVVRRVVGGCVEACERRAQRAHELRECRVYAYAPAAETPCDGGVRGRAEGPCVDLLQLLLPVALDREALRRSHETVGRAQREGAAAEAFGELEVVADAL